MVTVLFQVVAKVLLAGRYAIPGGCWGVEMQ